MTPFQIKIVKENFDQIEPLADQVADEFYRQLFRLDQSLRPLFAADLTGQKKKLITMLSFAVGTLDRMNVFEPALEKLGSKNALYCVRDEHYETVGNALVLTLRELLGAALSPELETAWTAAYTQIARTMMSGAAQAKYKTA